VTSSGTVTYLYDAFGNLAAEYGGTPSAYGTQYVTGDHLTSTRLVMPGTASQVASGTGIERHDYYPFGYEPAYGAGTDWRTAAMGYGPSTIRQKFTGQERDSESTLDFFQARYYSGPQGRFASVDPGNAGASLMDPQSWNGYSYVSNGPMMYTDPDGLGFWSDLGNFALNLGLDFLTAGQVNLGGLAQTGGGGTGTPGGVFGNGANGPFVFSLADGNDSSAPILVGADLNPLNDRVPLAFQGFINFFFNGQVKRGGAQLVLGILPSAILNAAAFRTALPIFRGYQVAEKAALAAKGLTATLVFNVGHGVFNGETTGFGNHALSQALARGVTKAEIAEALTHVPKLTGGSVILFIGRGAEVRVNKITGMIVTVIRFSAPNAK
jgi:RHS repeat-associated protein